jgi:hypothetical protein
LFCTKFARRLHRQRAIFFIQLRQKEGAAMDSYDNDSLLLLLDDNLFPVDDDVDPVQQ